MASIFTPTSFGAALGPYAIDITDCMGDSVGIINANTNYLAAYTAAVSASNASSINTLTTNVTNISSQVFGTGSTIQTTISSSSVASTFSTSTPGNLNTKPTTSHGAQIMSGVITPVYNNSKIVGRITIPIECSENKELIVAFFRNNETDAFMALPGYISGGRFETREACFFDTVTDTSPITYKVRICGGGSGSANFYINRNSSGYTLGSTVSMVFTLEEIKA